MCSGIGAKIITVNSPLGCVLKSLHISYVEETKTFGLGLPLSERFDCGYQTQPASLVFLIFFFHGSVDFAYIPFMPA
jgi:hypothetical protein